MVNTMLHTYEHTHTHPTQNPKRGKRTLPKVSQGCTGRPCHKNKMNKQEYNNYNSNNNQDQRQTTTHCSRERTRAFMRPAACRWSPPCLPHSSHSFSDPFVFSAPQGLCTHSQLCLEPFSLCCEFQFSVPVFLWCHLGFQNYTVWDSLSHIMIYPLVGLQACDQMWAFEEGQFFHSYPYSSAPPFT